MEGIDLPGIPDDVMEHEILAYLKGATPEMKKGQFMYILAGRRYERDVKGKKTIVIDVAYVANTGLQKERVLMWVRYAWLEKTFKIIQTAELKLVASGFGRDKGVFLNDCLVTIVS